MRRQIAITAFALVLALPLWAQRGGGHVGGGHGGGFSGHAGFSGGHMSGGHVTGGMHSGFRGSRGFAHSPSSFARFPQRNFSRGSFSHNGFHGNHFRHGHGNRFFFRNNCFGFGCRGFGYPWAYGAYYDPYWWWDSGSSYDEDYERERALANQMNEQSLEEQRMRQQGEDDPGPGRNDDRYARSAPAPRESESVSLPATVLVFRDQRQQEVRNYAIVGQTLWNFAPQHTQKIPLSDLDLAATAKANDERGLTFRIPAPGEAQ
jgi:hypothetical protein